MKLKFGPKGDEWGLDACPPRLNCKVCKLMGDAENEKKWLRDSYISGYPPWLLARMLGIDKSEPVCSHAWRHNWPRERKANAPDPKNTIFIATLAQLRSCWNKGTEETADRCLELLAQMLGVFSREPKGPPGESARPGWEDMLSVLRRTRRDK